MLVLPVLVSSLALPLSYFFLWLKTAYLLTAQKQDYHLLLKITKRILTWGKMWWEGACLCSWLYLMLCKSKFSFELGARRTESHGRPCCRDFLLTKELTWIILLQGNWIHLFHDSWIWKSWFRFLAVLFTNVQVSINSSGVQEGERQRVSYIRCWWLYIHWLQSRSSQSLYSVSWVIIATYHSIYHSKRRSSMSLSSWRKAEGPRGSVRL